MKKTVSILAAGGPAPGINTVIAVITKLFLKEGYRVIGLHEGYKSLFTDKPKIEELNHSIADKIYNQGGSYLQMSRYKPELTEFNSDFFEQNNVKLFVTIGGDDTASTAVRISNWLPKNLAVKAIHVPKTIDNDLPLEHGMPTFGFNTAVEEGTRIVKTLKTDAETSKMWFVTTIMGRGAGFLALSVGAATNVPIIILPELFANKTSFEEIVDILISSILERKRNGIEYGVALISEGVFDVIHKDSILKEKIEVSWDTHNNAEWGNVAKAHIINNMLTEKLKKMKLNIKTRPEELGYELRCCPPIAYDANLCALLAYGAKELFEKGESGCMVTVSPEGLAEPLYLDKLEKVEVRVGDKVEVKIKTRQVNLESALFKAALRNFDLLNSHGYEFAKKYTLNPEIFNFGTLYKS